MGKGPEGRLTRGGGVARAGTVTRSPARLGGGNGGRVVSGVSRRGWYIHSSASARGDDLGAGRVKGQGGEEGETKRLQ